MLVKMVRISLFTILSLTYVSTPVFASDGDSEACPMWLAPSYLNDINAMEKRYGIYAGRTYEKDAILPLQELVFPLVDFFEDFNKNRPMGKDVVEFLQGNAWQHQKVGSNFEGIFASDALIPGLGTLANYHSMFFNAELKDASVLLREPGEEFPKAGEPSLMRGAVTPYFNATLKAAKTIPAGMEIFPDFGQNYASTEKDPYQEKIHAADYQLADKIVDKLLELYNKHPDMSLDMQEDVMEFLLQKVLVAGTGPDAKSIFSLIPENPRKLQKVKDAGGTFMYRFRDMIRSEEWFRKNGFCLDTIVQGVSEIPNAGRGAFAGRDIKNGTNIAFTPLLHIANKNLLEMHPIIEGVFKEEEIATKHQMLLNYVFGHDESDMVFFPTAPQVGLINHGGAEANAHIEWAEDDDQIHNPIDYFDNDPEALAEIKEPILIMKVVADRDIAEGEEITIHYGASWEEAWSDYEEYWKAEREGRPHPLTAEDMRMEYKNKPLETVEYLEENPYPEDVFAACFIAIDEFEDGMLMTHQEYGTGIFPFASPTEYDEFDESTPIYKVDILERVEAPGFFYNYTVRCKLGDGPDDFSHVHNVPHSACTFMNQAYTSDIHLDGAFRYHIGIPDSMMPMIWRY